MAYALAKVRRTVSDFFAWWIGQLRGMLPARLSTLLSPSVNELMLEFVPPALLLRRRNGASVQDLGRVEVEGVEPEAVRAALRPILADLDLDRMRVCLRLPAGRALRKIVDLPAAAEENLRQVVGFEMDRLTPFSAEVVHYDVHVVGRDPETRRISAELMVLPRAAVDPSVELLRRIGLEADAVALPRGPENPLGTPWRVPLETAAPGQRRLTGWLVPALFVVAALLCVAGIATMFQRANARLEALDREVAAARKEAEEGRALQEQIARLGADNNFIVRKKLEKPATVEVLSELARVLPDDTWLYRVRLVGTELQTFGYSPNASALIGLLENSSIFGNAQFRAPLTRDQRMEAEQFHVAFAVGRKGQS